MIEAKKTRCRSARNTGSGVVFEIREACGETRESFAPRLGLLVTVDSLRQWERTGSFPTRNEKARWELLQCALTIPARDRSELIQSWIESEQKFWESLK